MKGRQRPSVVETLGRLLSVVVTAARVQAPDGALQLLAVLRQHFSRLRRLWADQAYRGDLGAWLWGLRPWRNVRLELVKRPEGTKGFHRLPKRWMVERTCAWWARSRCLSEDDAY